MIPDTDEAWGPILGHLSKSTSIAAGLDFYYVVDHREAPQALEVCYRPQMRPTIHTVPVSAKQLAEVPDLDVPVVLFLCDEMSALGEYWARKTRHIIRRAADGRWVDFVHRPLVEQPWSDGVLPRLRVCGNNQWHPIKRLPATLTLNVEQGRLLQISSYSTAASQNSAPADDQPRQEREQWYRIEPPLTGGLVTIELDAVPCFNEADFVRFADPELLAPIAPPRSESWMYGSEGRTVSLCIIFDQTTIDPEHWVRGRALVSSGDLSDVIGLGDDPLETIQDWNARLRKILCESLVPAAKGAGINTRTSDVMVFGFTGAPDVNPIEGLPTAPSVSKLSNSIPMTLFSSTHLSGNKFGYQPGVDLCDSLDAALLAALDWAEKAARAPIILIVADSPPSFRAPPSDPLWALQFRKATGADQWGGRAGLQLEAQRGDWLAASERLRATQIPTAWLLPVIGPEELVSDYRAQMERAQGFVESMHGIMRGFGPPMREVLLASRDELPNQLSSVLYRLRLDLDRELCVVASIES